MQECGNGCCCCYRKGTNFQANHNGCLNVSSFLDVVVATAKVQIFKQITTACNSTTTLTKLLLLPQRYKFSSKSQPKAPSGNLIVSCCCYRKGTNFQANHNPLLKFPDALLVVVATAKVQIFKQITTANSTYFSQYSLLLLPQRYKFSSKSQRYLVSLIINVSCCCYRKGTNFQANHNGRK